MDFLLHLRKKLPMLSMLNQKGLPMPEHTRFRRSVAKLRKARSEIINQLTRISYRDDWSGSEYRQLEDELREIDRLLANREPR